MTRNRHWVAPKTGTMSPAFPEATRSFPQFDNQHLILACKSPPITGEEGGRRKKANRMASDSPRKSPQLLPRKGAPSGRRPGSGGALAAVTRRAEADVFGKPLRRAGHSHGGSRTGQRPVDSRWLRRLRQWRRKSGSACPPCGLAWVPGKGDGLGTIPGRKSRRCHVTSQGNGHKGAATSVS